MYHSAGRSSKIVILLPNDHEMGGTYLSNTNVSMDDVYSPSQKVLIPGQGKKIKKLLVLEYASTVEIGTVLASMNLWLAHFSLRSRQ